MTPTLLKKTGYPRLKMAEADHRSITTPFGEGFLGKDFLAAPII